MKENIILHSIGDRAPTGTFTEIESVFEKVVNFVWGNKVISVCTPELYPGPYHIIVSGVRTGQIKGVEIRKCEGSEEIDPPPPLIKGGYNSVMLYTEDSRIGILLHADSKNSVLLYNSNLDTTPVNKPLLMENLKYLRITLLRRIEDESLIFLLERRVNRNARPAEETGADLHPEVCATLQKGTVQRAKEIPHKEDCTESETIIKTEDSKIGVLLNFEEAYRLKFKEMFKQLKEDKSPESVLAFHGYGYGLTPAGDDFIIGYMMGLQILSALGKNELSKHLDIIYSDMLLYSSNRLVNTFVQMAYEGSYSEPWKRFVEAMLSSDVSESPDLLKAILDIGETSGSDTLVGMITALELLI